MVENTPENRDLERDLLGGRTTEADAHIHSVHSHGRDPEIKDDVFQLAKGSGESGGVASPLFITVQNREDAREVRNRRYKDYILYHILLSDELKRLEAERDRLLQERGDNLKVQEEIRQQIRDEIGDREELLRQLNDKETQLDGLTEQLDGLDSRIEAVSERVDRSQNQLDTIGSLFDQPIDAETVRRLGLDQSYVGVSLSDGLERAIDTIDSLEATIGEKGIVLESPLGMGPDRLVHSDGASNYYTMVDGVRLDITADSPDMDAIRAQEAEGKVAVNNLPEYAAYQNAQDALDAIRDENSRILDKNGPAIDDVYQDMIDQTRALEDLQAERDAAQAEMQALEEAIQALENDAAASAERIAGLRADLSEKQEQLKVIDGKIDDVEENMELVKEKIRMLDPETEALEEGSPSAVTLASESFGPSFEENPPSIRARFNAAAEDKPTEDEPVLDNETPEPDEPGLEEDEPQLANTGFQPGAMG